MRLQAWARSGSAQASTRLDQGFAETGHHLGQRDGPAILGPLRAIHAHPELALAKRHVQKQNLEVFVVAIVLDRNSQVRFHKTMKTKGTRKINRARACVRIVV